MSYMEWPHASCTACQGKEVAFLRAKIIWSSPCLSNTEYGIWWTLVSWPTAYWGKVKSSQMVGFFPLDSWYGFSPWIHSLGQRYSDSAVVVSVVLYRPEHHDVACLPCNAWFWTWESQEASTFDTACDTGGSRPRTSTQAEWSPCLGPVSEGVERSLCPLEELSVEIG